MPRSTACIAALCMNALPAFAQDADMGASLYHTHCAACHGVDADGKGPRGPALLLQPIDLTRLSAANDVAFPLERVLRRIDGTDPLVSHGSPMPVYGPFFEGVANTPMKLPTGQPVLAPQPMADLVAYLLSIQID